MKNELEMRGKDLLPIIASYYGVDANSIGLEVSVIGQSHEHDPHVYIQWTDTKGALTEERALYEKLKLKFG